jgi:hypothetical protein
MNDRRTLTDLETLCDEGNLSAIWALPMLQRIAALTKPALAEAKRIYSARWGRDGTRRQFAAMLREVREGLLAHERATGFYSIGGSKPEAYDARRKDPAAVRLGRRGGMVRCPKGLAGMDPDRRAEIQRRAREAHSRNAAARRAARAMEDTWAGQAE